MATRGSYVHISMWDFSNLHPDNFSVWGNFLRWFDGFELHDAHFSWDLIQLLWVILIRELVHFQRVTMTRLMALRWELISLAFWKGTLLNDIIINVTILHKFRFLVDTKQNKINCRNLGGLSGRNAEESTVITVNDLFCVSCCLNIDSYP